MRRIERLRKDAADIFNTCVKAADPEQAVRRHLQLTGSVLSIGSRVSIDLAEFSRIVVLGGGKASASMARGVESVLGDRIAGGLVVVKHGHGLSLKRIEIKEGGHPIPTSDGESAALQVIEIAESLGSKDLVISCLSGGGSALLSAPCQGITPEEKRDITEKLLSSGADIFEINAVRKHVSRLKGGRLLERTYPATVINLMLSDVIGDDPGAIASGPFSPDLTTYCTAWGVLEEYRLLGIVPSSIVAHLEKGMNGLQEETLKPGNPIFEHVHNFIIGSNISSLKAGLERARQLGYQTAILSSTVRGDTVQAAKFHAYIAEEIRSSGNPLSPPTCILSGGETTVAVHGRGLGGRNQHFVLSIVEEASRIEGSVFFSAGTDGTDGPTDAAGAVADCETLLRASSLGMQVREYINNCDAYHFFLELGDLVKTGPTLTNVMDIHIVLLG